MKKTIFTTVFLCMAIFQFQLFPQPVNTTDLPVSTEVNIDQYNPAVFVNPWNPDEVITSSRKFSHQQQGQIVVFELEPVDFFRSVNAAQSWTQGTSLPNKCTENNSPAVQIDHDGRYYVNYCNSNTGVFMAWSDDQGNTWQEKMLKAKPDQPFYYVSTPNFHIDNSERSLYKGNVYATWRFIAYESADYCIELTRSEYGSDQWSNPTNICSGSDGDGNFEEWPVVRTGPYGEVYACWMNHNNGPGTGETSIGFTSSFDGGNQFGVNYNIPEDIKGLSGYNNLVDLDLISAPDMAVDISGGPYDGKLYIVWANVGVPGENTGQDVDIYMITSDSYGSSWSEPVKVNQDPAGLSKEHFMPAITCDPETGTVTVIYYDNRNLGSNMLEVWGSISYDGGTTFYDFKISDVAMNRTEFIGVNENSISEKISVSAANGKLVPVWADFRNQYCRSVTSAFDEKPVAKPDNLEAQVIDWDNGVALLNWTMDEPTGVQHYNIYRDNVLVGTTGNTQYQETLPEHGNYAYRVTAQFNTMESAPETDFLQWGEGTLTTNFDEFDVKLAPGTETTYVLRLENQGTLPVDYSFTTDHDPGADPTMGSDPDAFGYRWIDSDNPGGPGFDYIDISETGTEITGIQNDNYVGPYPIGFSFPFYENYYDEFYVSSNGVISFGGSFSNPVNSPIPIADGNNNFIAWCWDDLQKKSGGQVFYQEFEDYVVIQFKDYAQNGTLSLRYVINAEVILYKNGDILIQYLDYTSGLFLTNSCTIGIENGDGTDGLQVAYNEFYIHEELAVRFFNPGVKWLFSDIPYGTIEPGETQLQMMEFRSLDLPYGSYFANLNFTTNAVTPPQLIIPAKLEVTDDILEKPQNLDYGITGNDLLLTWDAPSGKNLLGYNLYESGSLLNTELITDMEYLLENPDPQAYLFQVTAIYSEGESNPEGDPLFVWISAEAEQEVFIPSGWSGISSWVDPEDPDVETMFSGMVDDLVLMMGDEGIYWPGQNINTIGNWNNKAGYKIKSAADHVLNISGTEITVPSVSCDAGWSLIPVLTGCDVPPSEIFDDGMENLVIIKEVAGTKVYWPEMNIASLQYLNPGKAYEINLLGSAVLYFPDCSSGGSTSGNNAGAVVTPWNAPAVTGISHTIAITGSAAVELVPGDIIGVFNTSGLCTGMAEYSSAPLALTAFGDDLSTDAIEGMEEGELMSFKLYRPSTDEVYNLTVEFMEELIHQAYFETNGLSGIHSVFLNPLNVNEQDKGVDFKIFPNPSSGSVNMMLNGNDEQLKIQVTNTDGQVINKQIYSGDSDLQLELDVPDGIYFFTVQGQKHIETRKILIAR